MVYIVDLLSSALATILSFVTAGPYTPWNTEGGAIPGIIGMQSYFIFSFTSFFFFLLRIFILAGYPGVIDGRHSS